MSARLPRLFPATVFVTENFCKLCETIKQVFLLKGNDVIAGQNRKVG